MAAALPIGGSARPGRVGPHCIGVHGAKGRNFRAGGLAPAPVTRDQVASLRSPNVVAGGAPGFEALGIAPTAMEAVLPDYLWRFRPSGQYAVLQESARNLRT